MKKLLSVVLAAALAAGMLAGCGAASSAPTSSMPISSAPASSAPAATPAPAARTTFRIAGLKGPTTMGMVKLMDDADKGEARHDYQVTMYGTANEIVPLLVSGELDVAAVPANLAATLYAKTNGQVQVAAINTLGVLYVVETGSTISTTADLKGKTIYSTGKGTTPEYILNYILRENGLDPETDVTIEYKSEASEVAAMLQAADEDVVAVLPQPYVTVLQSKIENLSVPLDLSTEWENVSGTRLVTGVLVARTDFINKNKAAFDEFLADYEASTQFVTDNVPAAAELVAGYGIIEKAPVAEKAIPACNITCRTGAEMKTDISAYLTVLFEQNPQSVGGAIPADDFYYEAD